MEKKFIKTTDKTTADKLTAYGFKLASHVGNIYTFWNEVPQHFNFEVIDKKKIVYDDKLSL
jgi:hypothetical protein